MMPVELERKFLVGVFCSSLEKVVEKLGISYTQLKIILYGDNRVKDWILR